MSPCSYYFESKGPFNIGICNNMDHRSPEANPGPCLGMQTQEDRQRP